MKRIAILNQKGGTGKTVTAVNLGAGLARLGKKVLLVDLDPQGNLSLHLKAAGANPNVTDLLLNGVEPRDVVRKTEIPGLDMIPAGIDLTQAEIQLVAEMGRESRLRSKLASLEDSSYDYVMIDCPPSLGLLTVNALLYCEEVFVPINCEFFGLAGVALLQNTLKAVEEQLGHPVKLAGALLTFFDPRKITCQKAEARVTEAFGERVFNTKIRDNVALAHATEAMVDVATFDPECNGALDYKALAEEVLSRGN